MPLRIDRKLLLIPAILFGIAAGVALSDAMEKEFPSWRYHGLAVSVTGNLISHDLAQKSFYFLANSTVPGGKPAPMRIRYADSTVWSSIEYAFDGGTATALRKKSEAERPLPPGSLVRFLIDPDADGTFVATGVTYLRRTGI